MISLITLLRQSHPAWSTKDVPWNLDVPLALAPNATRQQRNLSRLLHYLSGGGLKAFRSSLSAQRCAHRQTRFLSWLGLASLLWLVFFWV